MFLFKMSEQENSEKENFFWDTLCVIIRSIYFWVFYVVLFQKSIFGHLTN